MKLFFCALALYLAGVFTVPLILWGLVRWDERHDPVEGYEP